jgi:uncharacterized protein YecE (DUF72 family)
MKFDEDLLKAFFDILPRDTFELAKFAEGHDDKVKEGQACVEADAKRVVRYAVEFRHESFLTDRFTRLLHEYNVSLVVADVAGKFPTAEDVTADWVYVRLHGAKKMYASGYSPREIKAWSEKIRQWHAGGEPAEGNRIGGKAKPAKNGRDVFVFFDNTDEKVRAPVDAGRMMKELDLGSGKTVHQVLAELGVKQKKTASPRRPVKKKPKKKQK